MEWSQFSSKILGANFGNSILDNSNWDKVSEGVNKKFHIRNRVTLSLRDKKDNCKPNPLIQIGEHRLNIYYSKNISKRKLKECTISSGTEESMTSQAPSLTFHLKEWTSYFRYRQLIKLSKNKLDSKIIKSHQFSLERFHAVSNELNSEFISSPSSF